LLQTVSREGKLEGARASLLPLGNGRIAPPAEPCDGMEMEFGQAQPVVPVTANAFGGLSTLERRTLADWIAAARKGGIDTAEDLGVRSWPGVGSENIIGVFKSGHLLASWLIVGHSGSWAVASCGDNAVSRRVAGLADALALVYPREAGPQA